MSESTGTTERDADVFPVETVSSARPARTTAASSPTPSTPTPSPAPATDEQEHRPVTPVLAPEAPTASPAVAIDEPSVAHRDPRPASLPSHRADTTDEVVPTDPTEPRPASVARHSVETSAITLPVFAPEVDPSLPQPPDRLTLDDDVLVRMVERRLDDTATVDLMAVVQAQLQARRVEAARFASWAREMDRVGTDEAADALERTRLRFTGVIDVVLPVDLDEVRYRTPEAAAPAPAAAVAEAATVVAEEPLAAPAATPAPSAAAAAATPERPAPVAPARPTGQADRATWQGSRLLVGGLGLAALVVLAAVVLTLVDSGLLVSSVLATVAVPVAGGLGGAAALVAVVHRPSDAERVAARGPAAVVAAIVVSAVLGYGVLVTSAASLAWQGWLVRLVGFTGMTPEVAVVAAVLVAAVVAFVVAVLVTGLRQSTRR
jgi:hypothetical protein